jgi:hypothetical protein
MRPHQAIFERPGIELTKLAFRFEFNQLFFGILFANFNAKVANLKNIK